VISESQLQSNFLEIFAAAGIRRRASGHYPRRHDFRHTFCVHALEAMVTKGFDLYTSAPLLTAYMGHKSMRETEYYLRLVSENFSHITDKMAEYALGIFPKVGDENAE